MKHFILAVSVLLAGSAFGAEAPSEIPTIAIMAVTSSSYDDPRTKLMTDVLRSELFKSGLFRIKEQGLVLRAIAEQKVDSSLVETKLLEIGRAVAVQKLVLTSLERFSDTIALNIRIVDVSTTLIDYTENVFIKNENSLFDALKEVVTKIELRYSAGRSIQDQQTPEARKAWLLANWTLLGAKEADLSWLVDNRQATDDYLSLRQYDISFDPSSYVEALRTSVDLDVVRSFLQSGISWPSVQRALRLGISKLDKYRETFLSAGYTFDDYLTAYEHKLATPRQYKGYLDTFDKDFFLVGFGGVANDFPIANADFRYPLGQVAWEHFWTPSLESSSRFSTEAGLFLLNVIVPVPYVGLTMTFGTPPFFGKVGIGEHAEVLLGGHFGTHIRAGFEILNQFEMTLMVVPFGTQPKVSYVGLDAKQGEVGYVPIVFPYAGVMFTYKIPVGN